MRKVVSDRNGRHNKGEDAADNDQPTSETKYHSGLGAAPPSDPAEKGGADEHKTHDIERTLHQAA